ncbi:hypothetical protein RIVM261_050340 [Rivularia sp. IAM M-261]|nr:hypothetical protein RIVM261_050340 [Rivularia sp. IAM M-261]
MLINDLRLREARPSDRPHLLLWDTPNDLELNALVYREDAECISYRTNLLSRVSATSCYLALDKQLERELDEIKTLCVKTNKPVLLLKDLDCLITYLKIKPESPITLFWKSLFLTKHLESILWILLPSKLVNPIWDESRMRVIC